MVIKGRVGVVPVDFVAQPEFIQERQQMPIGAANEMIEPLDGLPLQLERARQSAQLRCRFEEGDAPPGPQQIIAGGQAGQPGADHDHMFRGVSSHCARSGSR